MNASSTFQPISGSLIEPLILTKSSVETNKLGKNVEKFPLFKLKLNHALRYGCNKITYHHTYGYFVDGISVNLISQLVNSSTVFTVQIFMQWLNLMRTKKGASPVTIPITVAQYVFKYWPGPIPFEIPHMPNEKPVIVLEEANDGLDDSIKALVNEISFNLKESDPNALVYIELPPLGISKSIFCQNGQTKNSKIPVEVSLSRACTVEPPLSEASSTFHLNSSNFQEDNINSHAHQKLTLPTGREKFEYSDQVVGIKSKRSNCSAQITSGQVPKNPRIQGLSQPATPNPPLNRHSPSICKPFCNTRKADVNIQNLTMNSTEENLQKIGHSNVQSNIFLLTPARTPSNIITANAISDSTSNQLPFSGLNNDFGILSPRLFDMSNLQNQTQDTYVQPVETLVSNYSFTQLETQLETEDQQHLVDPAKEFLKFQNCSSPLNGSVQYSNQSDFETSQKESQLFTSSFATEFSATFVNNTAEQPATINIDCFNSPISETQLDHGFFKTNKALPPSSSLNSKSSPEQIYAFLTSGLSDIESKTLSKCSLPIKTLDSLQSITLQQTNSSEDLLFSNKTNDGDIQCTGTATHLTENLSKFSTHLTADTFFSFQPVELTQEAPGSFTACSQQAFDFIDPSSIHLNPIAIKTNLNNYDHAVTVFSSCNSPKK